MSQIGIPMEILNKMTKRKPQPMPYGFDVSTEYQGKTYSGRYIVKNDLITVLYGGAQIKANLGGMSGYPEVLAAQLLSELVKKEVERREEEKQIQEQNKNG